MVRWLVVGALLLLMSGCDETPTGRNRIAWIPQTMMADMGNDAFEQMRQTMPVVTDPAIKRLAECVSVELVSALGESWPEVDMPDHWDVVVFDNPMPNAFALPGGRIGINSGLLRVAQTPDQLAAVIGHEIGHVIARHGNERLTQQLGIQAVLMVIGLASDSEVSSDALIRALGLGSQLGITLPFSRAHEVEADRIGLQLMARAGFNPKHSIELWHNMMELDDQQPFELLSTHPHHESRIAVLEESMSQASEVFSSVPRAACSPL